MTHPQNSPRGLFSKQSLVIGGATIANPSSTNLQFPGGIALSGQTNYLSANSTAFILPTVSALPATRVVGGFAFISNSTGKALVFHSTGTTWLYASGTSVLA